MTKHTHRKMFSQKLKVEKNNNVVIIHFIKNLNGRQENIIFTLS